MKIEAGKHYRTKCGDRARIYAIDGSSNTRVHGAFLNDKGDPAGWPGQLPASLCVSSRSSRFISVVIRFPDTHPQQFL